MSRSTNRNRGDSIVPTRKRQDETNDVQIEIEKREGRKEKITKYRCGYPREVVVVMFG